MQHRTALVACCLLERGADGEQLAMTGADPASGSCELGYDSTLWWREWAVAEGGEASCGSLPWGASL